MVKFKTLEWPSWANRHRLSASTHVLFVLSFKKLCYEESWLSLKAGSLKRVPFWSSYSLQSGVVLTSLLTSGSCATTCIAWPRPISRFFFVGALASIAILSLGGITVKRFAYRLSNLVKCLWPFCLGRLIMGSVVYYMLSLHRNSFFLVWYKKPVPMITAFFSWSHYKGSFDENGVLICCLSRRLVESYVRVIAGRYSSRLAHCSLADRCIGWPGYCWPVVCNLLVWLSSRHRSFRFKWFFSRQLR